MSPESDDISKWIQELIARSTREQMQAMNRLSNLVQRISSGELDQLGVRQEFSRFVKDESTRYVEDLTRLGLSFQAALLELNRKYSDRFFDQVIGSPINQAQGANGQGRQRKEISLSLSGKPGDELVKNFVIENKRAEEETVTFLISEFSDAQSNQAFRAPLQLQPARLVLRPGEERLVAMHLPLLPELFQAGQIYLATVIARGHSDVILSLRVEVANTPVQGDLTIREQPNEQDQPQPQGAPAAKRPRKSKTIPLDHTQE
jgi:hypothetical protein